MKIVFNSKLVKFISLFNNIAAITLYPYVFIKSSKEETSTTLIRHELIHVHQIKEVGIVPFYLIYLWDFFLGLILHRSFQRAYYSIRFEQEAYKFQKTTGYVQNRNKGLWKAFKVKE